jgi:acetyl-CoA carboxylase biotin carboxyl carrier protein
MNIEEIRKVAELMEKHDLSEFSIHCEDMKLKLKRGADTVVAAAPAPAMALAAPSAPAAAAPTADAQADDLGETIDSPIVGTFYAAPSPDADSFVKVGDTVSADTVVCIVEAMKVMNEIKAEKSGVIKRVLVDNATPVEFGQPLFEIG